MKTLFWGFLGLLYIAAATLGFAIVSLLLLVGLILNFVAEALASLFDWYLIASLRGMTRIKERL